MVAIEPGCRRCRGSRQYLYGVSIACSGGDACSLCSWAGGEAEVENDGNWERENGNALLW